MYTFLFLDADKACTHNDMYTSYNLEGGYEAPAG